MKTDSEGRITMLVSVAGFGSLWRRRFDKHQADSHQFARGVYYNTTGVEITGTIRQRPRSPVTRASTHAEDLAFTNVGPAARRR